MRLVILSCIVAALAGCKPQGLSPTGRLADMLQSNARLVGYLYSADQPYVLAAFHEGTLQWRSDPKSHSVSEGPARVFDEPDRRCLGFERKNLSMPTHGPERYLVCEATQPIQHRNYVPRSQDFSFGRGDVFLEYQPPQGTGFPQLYYAGAQK